MMNSHDPYINPSELFDGSVQENMTDNFVMLQGSPTMSELDFKFIHDEETTDIENIKPENFMNFGLPSVCITQNPPPKGSHPGNYQFQVSIAAKDTKKKYVYSHKLNRIYVDMNSNFSVQFSWNYQEVYGSLYVRATTMYSSEDQAEKRVERCINHRHCPQSNLGELDKIKMHVLRSARPYGSDDLYYCGDADNAMSWFSVLVKFPNRPADGNEEFSHPYVFVCKTSCNSGINRRPIEIIFSLEDDRGVIHGRQTVGVKVCSCPKRDLIKDEQEESESTPRAGKRKIGPKDKIAADQPPNKMVATAKRADGVFSIAIVGKANAHHVLATSIKFMKADLHEARTKEERDMYLKYIDQNQKVLDSLDNFRVIQ